MYVCMYVCMYICIYVMYVSMYACMLYKLCTIYMVNEKCTAKSTEGDSTPKYN